MPRSINSLWTLLAAELGPSPFRQVEEQNEEFDDLELESALDCEPEYDMDQPLCPYPDKDMDGCTFHPEPDEDDLALEEALDEDQGGEG